MARDDLNSLLSTLLPFAEEMLSRHGEFYPFGATMTASGEIQQMATYTGDERPGSQELIELLMGAFRAQAVKKEVRAVGLCLDVRTITPGHSDKTDAICARLRHADGESVDVLLPYQKYDSGEVMYGETFATQGDQDVFG